MFSRGFLSSAATVTLAIGTTCAISFSKEHCFIHRSPVSCHEESTSTKTRFAQAILLRESSSNLLKSYPPLFPNVKAHHMTIAVNPENKTLAKVATTLGRPVDLQVLAIVSDNKCQAAVVQVKTIEGIEEDEGSSVPCENLVAHVTMSLAPDVEAVYSNAMLESVLENGNGFRMNWQGEFPDGRQVRVQIPSQPLILESILCLSDIWNEEESRCGKKKECGFCQFMKIGPCGDKFQAWEVCIESCKENEDDFIDKCANQTLLLKNCVEIHPEYYYSLLDDDNKKKEKPESKDEEIEEKVS